MRSKSHLNPKPTEPLKPTKPITTTRAMRRILAAALLSMMAFAAVLMPIGAPAAEAQSSPIIVDTYAIQVHGNGSQMEVKRIEIHDDHTLVVFDVTNGRDYTTQFNVTTRDTRLEDDRGRSYPLLRGFQASVEPGQGSTITLGFAPIPEDTDTISFFFRDRDGDSNDVREGFPSFQFNDIDLTEDIDEPALPENLTPEETQTHPNGTDFTVLAVEFEDGFTRVEFEARNPTDRRVDLSNGRHSSFIEDNLGNRYYVKLADGAAFLRLPQDRRFEGALLFSGRIHPAATSITLLMNHDESATDDRSLAPKFELGPWVVAEGSAATGDLLPLEVDETQEHPNESQLTIEGLRFEENGTLVDFDFDNGDKVLVFLNACCEHTFLLDDLGNQYLLKRPEENVSLQVQRGDGLHGTMAFLGGIDPQASEITVVFNDDSENGSGEFAVQPEFRFGPYELERAAGDDDSLDDILESFNARAGRRSVTLTVPADGLFEPGESDLDEGRTFEQLLRVLELYEDDDIEIVAHTDSEGSSFRNQRLSERQADALAEALADAGLDEDLIIAEGDGDDRPIVDNDGDESLAANRRVSITIFTTDGLPD